MAKTRLGHKAVCLSLDEETIRAIDIMSKGLGMTKSAVVDMAVRRLEQSEGCENE